VIGPRSSCRSATIAVAPVGRDADLLERRLERLRAPRAAGDRVEAVGDPGDLERGLRPVAGVDERRPLALVAELVDPGDRARQRANVAVPEVRHDALEGEDRPVEVVVVDPRPERVEGRRHRPGPAVVERGHCVRR
jgi:hypothetical protein